VLFGVWAVVHVVLFSAQQGIFHPYYVSALAPAVAALAGAGVVALWRLARKSWAGLAVLQVTIALTAWLAVVLLARTPDFAPALRIVIPVAAAVAVLGLVALRAPGRLPRRALAVVAVAAAIALAAGPAAYSAANVGRSLNGNNVIAGPASAATQSVPGGGGRPSGGARSAGGGSAVSSELISYLEAHQGSARYLVAASGSMTTAPIIIQTGEAVVTIGGFNGGDPAPTAAQLAKLVADGELSYVLVGGQGGAPGGSSTEVTAWVKQHGTVVKSVSTTGMTLYRVSV
jgi:4-amino-4-deoxy-L-arabinose transferase-like glycosyltransferase